jgi:ADP-ribose pyrophosphatase YjhB (NUDIX family)
MKPRDLDEVLADIGMVGPDGLLQRVVRLAAYGLIERDGRTLLCRVAPGYLGVGLWTLPGGGLTFGEDPEADALREVLEETGLIAQITGTPLILSDTGAWPVADPPLPYHQVRFVYPMEVVGGEERAEVDGSSDAIGWYTKDEMAGMKIVPLVSLAVGLPANR